MPLLLAYAPNMPASPPLSCGYTGSFLDNEHIGNPHSVLFTWDDTSSQFAANHKSQTTLSTTSEIIPTILSPIGANRRHKFECPVCQKGYTSRTRAETHINSRHLKVRPFLCNGACGEMFW
ncbi:hypothetical protein CPB86DRAFT_779383 [Serendipita vermifera]|nr:hypothetical protein CPB86DRAFT_779383 [Serendipita vermifera]